MRIIWISILFLLSLGTICFAADTVEAPADCKQCGMNRTKFGHSRMVVTYADGSSTGTCSINCVVTDAKAQKGKKVKSYQVADYNSRKLTDATKASWVIGGKKRGVMTAVPKWAFADRKDADAFIKGNGGRLTNFDEALKAAEGENPDKNEHKGHTH
jgi:nitrous oxide reductase accessory protein NosL